MSRDPGIPRLQAGEDVNLLLARERVLNDAAHLISRSRNVTYGSPTSSFTAIGALWTAYLEARVQPQGPVSTADVAIMLGLVKIARLAKNPKHYDSWVDLAGYAGCGAEVAEEGEDS